MAVAGSSASTIQEPRTIAIWPSKRKDGHEVPQPKSDGPVYVVLCDEEMGKGGARVRTCKREEDLRILLDAIFPPREWEEDGLVWRQEVSCEPASREDLSSLDRMLTERLQTRQAKEKGVCPVRRDLHSDLFNEMVRAIAVRCPEQGYLLARIKNEMDMTLEYYRAMFSTGVQFGASKAPAAQEARLELEEEIEGLKEKIKHLKKVLHNERVKYDFKEESLQEELESRRKLQEESLQEIAGKNQRLKLFLEEFIKEDPELEAELKRREQLAEQKEEQEDKK